MNSNYPQPSPQPESTGTAPAWGPPARGIFIDVLGTIVEPTEHGGFPSFEDAKFYDGVLDGLFKATQAGWTLYLIGNIDSVAFGRQSIGAWKDFSQQLHAHLKSLGIVL